jgi:hypothetical protein
MSERERPRRKYSFDPNSLDSMFATILRRLDAQDKTTEERHAENKHTLDEIKEQTELTNGRVTKLENWRTYHKGYAAGIAFIVSIAASGIAWLFWHLFSK